MTCKQNSSKPWYTGLGKQVAHAAGLALIAFIAAVAFHSLEGNDRSGYGMVALAMTVMALPAFLACSVFAFVFRNTWVGTAFSGTAFAISIFVGSVLAMG